MSKQSKHIIVVGGGTAGSVLAARLSEAPSVQVTLLEAGPDHDAYNEAVMNPARATEAWSGGMSVVMTPMATATGVIPMIQGRLLGGCSAINAMATLRGLPADYDGWAAAGFDGWSWSDVKDTFIAAERDGDFPESPIHGNTGPLPVRRWRTDEHSHAHAAYLNGMLELGVPRVTDLNDPDQLPGIGVFPATIDDNAQRVTTSLAYLNPSARARENLTVRTGVEVHQIKIDNDRVIGVALASGEEIAAEEVVVAAGALWSPHLLMCSGIGPSDHLSDHGIKVRADLPVGSRMSDHLGAGIPYRHDGPRGGTGGPAQTILVGSSNGTDVDYHAFPIVPSAPAGADGEDAAETQFTMTVLILRSTGQGSVRLGDSPAEGPVVTAPPLVNDAPQRFRHAFSQLAAWERSAACRSLACEPLEPHDLTAPGAVAEALERNTMSYAHMTGTCPMGPVLDADCRVHGITGLRVADASVMPSIPSGNTYLGCVMVAERIARKMMQTA
jgi:choline dehydrogenase